MSLTEHGTPSIILGPPLSATPEEKLRQERNAGYNEGWLAAIDCIQKFADENLAIIIITRKLDEMKDYRR